MQRSDDFTANTPQKTPQNRRVVGNKLEIGSNRALGKKTMEKKKAQSLGLFLWLRGKDLFSSAGSDRAWL